MRTRMFMVVALTVLLAACGGGGESADMAGGTSELAEAPAEMAPTVAAVVEEPAANLPSAADLTMETLPGESGGTEIQNTASGLGYVVLSEGSGDKPAADSTVTVHYSGYLTDGTKFDSSVDRGTPFVTPLQGVIPGWTEGVQLMSPGAKYKLIVPPEMGYGATGFPPVIPANATLVFDVELLEFE